MNSAPRCRSLAASVLTAISINSAQATDVRQPQVVVTATRTPLAIDQSLSSVSLIDRSAIEASGSTDIVSLLRREAGVDIVRGGGLGQQTSVFLRGSNSNQVLVLVDGVRVAAATTGAYAWEQLPLAQIERIEIVRGPRAALYGSDAIGGVIQIFTRKPVGASGAIGIGNHETGVGEAGYGWQGERGRVGLRAALADSEGFNAQNPAGFAFDPDRDGFTQRSLAGDAGYDFSGMRLSATLLHSDNDVEFDPGDSNARNTAFGLRAEGGGERAWQVQASAAHERLDTPVFFSRFETRRRQLDAQQALPLGIGELLYGASLQHEAGRVLDTGSGEVQYDDDRDLWAAFAAWRGGRGTFDWELAARHDDYDHFGGEATGQAALGWSPNSMFKLRANLGEGFRAPGLNELFSPGFFGFFAGNPALEPEHARNVELAAEFSHSAWQFGLRGYRTRVSDLIDFAGGDTFQAINIGRARLAGIELEWRWQREAWRASGNFTWQEAEDLDSDRALLRRPERKGNIAVEYAIRGGWIGLDLFASGPRPDVSAELPGHALLGVTARWPLAETLDVDLRIDNLLDRDYESIHGFNAPGMTALLQLRWRQ